MDRTRGAWEIGFGFNNPSYRGGDPERFRDEAKGLGRVALLGQFFSMEQLKGLWLRVLCPRRKRGALHGAWPAVAVLAGQPRTNFREQT